MFQIQWHERICINCLKCVEVCPRRNLTSYRGMPAQSKTNTCSGCGYCTMSCPSGSIYHVTLNKDYWGAWTPEIRNQTYKMAKTRKYVIEGKGTNRKFLTLDNLMFLPGQLKYPPLLDSEHVNTKVTIGKRSKHPITLETPVMIGAMSFGSLSIEAKVALAKGASSSGSISNTGEGGMHEKEREAARFLTLQYSTGRFGVDQDDLKKADMIEVKVGQGAKPGLGGHLLADKITPEIAKVRNLIEKGARFRPGENAISPSRHLDINSPQDLKEKVRTLKAVTDHIPIAIKIAGGHVEDDLDIIINADPDVIVLDGSEGGTGAAPEIAKNHAGLPLIYLLTRTLNHLEKRKVRDRFFVIAAGGLKGPADFVKMLALGADAVYTSGFMKFALGCVYCRSCETGRCPVGITTQDPSLRQRLDVKKRAKEVENLFSVTKNEISKICRLCGCNDIKKLNKSHLSVLSLELSKCCNIPMGYQQCKLEEN